MSNITKILVTEQNYNSARSNGLVLVTVMSNDLCVDEYEAYHVRNLSLSEYLSNNEEIKKASFAAQGRFTFSQERFGENLRAYFFSRYVRTILESNNISPGE